MASVSSVRARRPHDGWQHITPFLSAAFHSFENIAHCYEERDGVRLLWCTQQRKVNTADWRGQIIIVSQSSVPPFQVSHLSPGSPSLVKSPHLTLSLSSHDLYRLRHKNIYQFRPRTEVGFEAKTRYRRLAVK